MHTYDVGKKSMELYQQCYFYGLYIKNIQQRYKIVKTDEMHSGKKLISKMYGEAAHNRDMLA